MIRPLILALAAAATVLAQDIPQVQIARISQATETAARDLLHDLYDTHSTDILQKTYSQIDRESAMRQAEATDTGANLRAGSARMFRETGSINPGLGSTSAVVKTSATQLLAVSLESGAVTGTTDKSTATFQLNALPVWQLLNGPRGVYGCGGLQARSRLIGEGICESGPGFWLRGLTASISLNVNSKETTIPVVASAAGTNQTVITGVRVLTNPSKLSTVGLKYELFQRERNNEQLVKALGTMASELNKKLDANQFDLKLVEALNTLINDAAYKAKRDAFIAGALQRRNDSAQLAAYINGQIEELTTWIVATQAGRMLANIQSEYNDTVNTIALLEAQNLFKKSLAFDFVHSRPTDQPFLDTFRLDFNTPLGKNKDCSKKKADGSFRDASCKSETDGDKKGAPASLDFNSSVTMYHEEQTINNKSVRLRNASASLALNLRLGSWGSLGSPVLTLAGYYQYMFNNGLIDFNSSAFTPGASTISLRGPAQEVLNTKGSIGLGQLRLEIPLGNDSGLTIPIAVSYANRTELIKDPNRKFWQGHIGLSYDISKLQEAFLKKK